MHGSLSSAVVPSSRRLLEGTMEARPRRSARYRAADSLAATGRYRLLPKVRAATAAPRLAAALCALCLVWPALAQNAPGSPGNAPGASQTQDAASDRLSA